MFKTVVVEYELPNVYSVSDFRIRIRTARVHLCLVFHRDPNQVPFTIEDVGGQISFLLEGGHVHVYHRVGPRPVHHHHHNNNNKSDNDNNNVFNIIKMITDLHSAF